MKATQAHVYGMLRTERFPLIWKVGALVSAVLLLYLASKTKVELPLVPITMQTAAVLAVSVLLGRQLGPTAIVSWFALGLAGLPVFTGVAAGPAYFIGNTGGYLAGFLAASLVCSTLVDLGSVRRSHPLFIFAVMVLGAAIITLLGFAWLATIIGVQKAWAFGVMPFIAGDLIKCVFATAVVLYAKSKH